MNKRSLFEQTKCRFREFRREPSAMFWVMFMPLMWMIILGFAFSQPRIERVAIGVLEGGDSNLQSSVEGALNSHPDVRLHLGSSEQLTTLLQRGTIALLISTPEEEVVFTYDPTNPEARRAHLITNDILQHAHGREDVVPTVTAWQQTRGSRYVDFLVPGLLGLSILTSSLFGIGMTIVANRRENILKRYLCTPMPPSHYIISHLFGRGIVLAFEVTTVLLAGWLIFDFRISGSFVDFLLLATLGSAAFTAIALVCASRTRSLPLVSGITNLIALPMMMLSGVFFSKSNFPETLLPWIERLPLTALNDGFRKIALEGESIWQLGSELTVLSLTLIVAATAARFLFRWH